MRRLILIVSGLAAAVTCFALVAAPAFGDDVASVNAKVTVAAPCVVTGRFSGSGADIDFGVRAFSSSPTANSGTNDNATQVTNCGASAEDIYAKGGDATSSDGLAPWTLTSQPYMCVAGINKYSVGIDAYADLSSTTRLGVLRLSNANQLLWHAAQGEKAEKVITDVSMPCTGSSGAGKLMSFQIVYTATL